MTPIRSALLRVASSVAKHMIKGGCWDEVDECFQVDLRASEKEIEELVSELVKTRISDDQQRRSQ